MGDESKKKRNLELGLGDIDAIEKTIKFGVAEGGLEFGIGGSFFGKEFFGVIAGFLIVLSVISVEAGSRTSKGAREGIGDGA